MHMITIPIGLDEKIIEKIDLLIKIGRYKNRTEALRDQIVKGLEKISLLEENNKVKDKINLFLKLLLDMKDPPTIFPTQRSAIEIVTEERNA